MLNKTIAILGAGKVGIVLAQLAIKAGYRVLIAGSGEVKKIALTVEVLVPGAEASLANEATKEADIIILALPLSKYKTILKDGLDDKLVIDAMNYWWEVDGIRSDLTNPLQSSSELIQTYLSKSQVVKAFNHMGYHDLLDESSPKDTPHRKAIALAGDNKDAVNVVSEIVDSFGFEPLYIGELSESQRLEPGSEAFGANVSKKALQEMVDNFYQTERGQIIREAQEKVIH